MIFGREPLVITSAVRLVVLALIGFQVLDWTPDQIAKTLGALEAVLLLIGRQNVASPRTLRLAGTSLRQVTKAANAKVRARLQIVGPDASQAPK